MNGNIDEATSRTGYGGVFIPTNWKHPRTQGEGSRKWRAAPAATGVICNEEPPKLAPIVPLTGLLPG